MPIEDSLLILPIHRRTYKDYYAARAADEAKEKRESEEIYLKPFDELPPETKVRLQDLCFWPPWLFNDVIGALVIGSDLGSQIAGEIYVKRKFFPDDSRERWHRRLDTALKSNEVLRFRELPKQPVISGDNKSYVEATLLTIQAAQTLVRRLKKCSQAAIWTPEYDLACLNMAEADRQIQARRLGTAANPRQAPSS